MTRRERRASRQRGFVTAAQARLAARLARVGYKRTNESGALRVPSRVRTWHLNGRANGHKPRPGQQWDQSGPTYVVASAELGRLEKPVIHHLWRKLMSNQ